MYTIGNEHDQGLTDAEVIDWTHRLDINETVSPGAAAVLAAGQCSKDSPLMASMVQTYKETGDPLHYFTVMEIEELIREIEYRRRSVFLSSFYTADEKEWNCTDLDALQAYVEVVGGLRARV